MTIDELPLRERKKARTRRDLIEVSADLFARQGYEGTTLEQICERAEVSVPTLLAYFQSKDRLALAREWDQVEELRTLMMNPDRQQGALEVWRDFARRGGALAAADTKTYLKRAQEVVESAALRKAQLDILFECQKILEEALAVDFGASKSNELPIRLLATLLAFGHQTVVDHWVATEGTGDLEEAVLAVVDFTIEQSNAWIEQAK